MTQMIDEIKYNLKLKFLYLLIINHVVRYLEHWKNRQIQNDCWKEEKYIHAECWTPILRNRKLRPEDSAQMEVSESHSFIFDLIDINIEFLIISMGAKLVTVDKRMSPSPQKYEL